MKRNFRSKLPPATQYGILPKDLECILIEATNKWVWPVEVVRLEGKIIDVSDGVTFKSLDKSQILPTQTNNVLEYEL